jgi:myb proto-oncogene protein
MKLKDAVQTHGGKSWGVLFALVPGRTQTQCRRRWKAFLDPNIDRASGRKGRWTAEEDSKLKDAVQTHGGKNWIAIAVLVPGRTQKQCLSRWKDVLDPNINRASRRTGEWSEDEDRKLQDAVQAHGGKNWGGIAALVPNRTISQCTGRWHSFLKDSIDQATVER